eukprot:137088_1
MNQLLLIFLCSVYLIDSWIRRSIIHYTKIHIISNQFITDIPYHCTIINPYINTFLMSLHISYIMIDPNCTTFHGTSQFDSDSIISQVGKKLILLRILKNQNI